MNESLYPKHASAPVWDLHVLAQIPPDARWLKWQVTVICDPPAFGCRSIDVLPGWIGGRWLQWVEEQHPEALR